MEISLADADRIIARAIAKAEELNIRVSVAVVDAGGRLLAFKRMDGAAWNTIYGCQGKAIASVGFARPSAELQERADLPIFRGIIAAEGGHMIPHQGALPIMRDGYAIGACGVGGGTSQQDEECARAAIEGL